MIYKNFKTRVCENCFISINENKYMSKYEFNSKIIKENYRRSVPSRFGDDFREIVKQRGSFSKVILKKKSVIDQHKDIQEQDKLNKSQSLLALKNKVLVIEKTPDKSIANRSNLTSASTTYLSKRNPSAVNKQNLPRYSIASEGINLKVSNFNQLRKKILAVSSNQGIALYKTGVKKMNKSNSVTYIEPSII